MAESVSELLDRLLDRFYYESTAKRMIKAIGSATDSARVRAAMAAFDAEIERLHRENLPLRPDNPLLRNLTAAIDDAMQEAVRIIDDTAGTLADAAADAAHDLQTALPLVMGQSPTVMARWNVVSASALRKAVRFTEHPAWAEQLAQYAGASSEMINDLVLRGFQAGWNPLRTAREITGVVEGFPRSQANIITRTMYLQSYRQAAAESYRANRQIISKIIRVATLDNRVCPVCVALHGTEIPVGEAVEAHYQCRCVSVAQIAGAELPIGPSGEEWFAGLPESEQRAMLGPGAFERYKTGSLQLSDLVGRKNDPLYGPMLYQKSLREIDGLPPRTVIPLAAIPPPATGARSIKTMFSSFVEQDPDLRRAADLIDRVHGIEYSGDRIGVQYGVRKNVNGYYNPPSREYPAGRIDIKRGVSASTFIHETGHALDLSLFGSGKNYATMSRQNNELSPLLGMLRQSEAQRTLSYLHLTGDRDTRRTVNYLADPPEMFTRAYVQYIATRTNDPALLREIRDIRALRDSKGNPHLMRETYWSDEDFAPIARAFDELFRGKGWLR